MIGNLHAELVREVGAARTEGLLDWRGTALLINDDGARARTGPGPGIPGESGMASSLIRVRDGSSWGRYNAHLLDLQVLP